MRRRRLAGQFLELGTANPDLAFADAGGRILSFLESEIHESNGAERCAKVSILKSDRERFRRVDPRFKQRVWSRFFGVIGGFKLNPGGPGSTGARFPVARFVIFWR
jgi:hypothetical protein